MDLTSRLIGRLRYVGVEDIKANIGFYPSSSSVEYKDDNGRTVVVGACLRQQYYAICNVPETNPPSDESLMKMFLGNLIHDGIASKLVEDGIGIAKEVRMYRPGSEGLPPISGRIDIFLRDESTGYPVVGEIKTGAGWFFEKECINGSKDEPARPKEEHVCQVLPYVDFYGQFDPPVEKGILYYVDRGEGSTSQFTIRMDDDGSAIVQGRDLAECWRHINMPAINARWNVLTLALKDGKLPKRDYALQYTNIRILELYGSGKLNKADTTSVKKSIEAGRDQEPGPLLVKGDWQCGWCRYKDLCYGKEWNEGCHPAVIANPFRLSPEQRGNLAANDEKSRAAENAVDIM